MYHFLQSQKNFGESKEKKKIKKKPKAPPTTRTGTRMRKVTPKNNVLRGPLLYSRSTAPLVHPLPSGLIARSPDRHCQGL
ncbi:unnamed protein product [Penicillium camemberti]|uniref:Str. FM013 n=1 Tax=Penicillium camemberti (strain FM 013) TaxID=1429867 RepID=A0A0G4NWN3_PENC3|nr:unnamed protein product [Penicillium camemberti]